MKRLIAVAVLVLLSVSVCLVGSRTVHRVCTETNRMLISESEETETALSAREYWRNNRIRLGLFVNHDDLDEIDTFLTELTVISDRAERERIYALFERKIEDIITGQHFDPEDFL